MHSRVVVFLRNYTPFILLAMALIQLGLYWPGELTPDSMIQYGAAVSGQYSDHHPPIMSFVWRYLDMILKGPGLMLVMHLGFFYTGLYFIYKSASTHPLRYLVVLFPLVPPILCYAHYIWKDIGFAYAYVCVGGILAWVSSRPEPLNRLSYRLAIPLVLILYYGSAIKYQAQFCAPIFLAWIIFLMLRPRFFVKRWFLLTALVASIFQFTLLNVNEYLTREAGKQHSWQLVKLYDLAAISVALDKSLFPEFTKNPNFTMDELHKRFLSQYVDSLVFPKDAILKGGSTPEEREILWQTWFHEILAHPYIYMKHRFSNWACVLLSTPMFLDYLALIDRVEDKNSLTYQALYYGGRVLGYLFMAHFLSVLLCFAYLILGIVALRKSWAAVPLVAFNAVGMMMVLLLLFLSMAGTPRYTYITICMVHLSHIWAYICVNHLIKKTI